MSILNLIQRFGSAPNNNTITFLCDAGVMDVGIYFADNLLWEFEDGTTSSLDRPAKTLLTQQNVKVTCDDWTKHNIRFEDNNTDSRLRLNLSDLKGNLTYQLRLYNCTNITGSLADLKGNLTYFLNLDRCANITGSLSDLKGNITNYLNLYGCNVTGVYTPVGDGTPSYTYLDNTSLSTTDMDNTLIAYANASSPKSNGHFRASGMTRSSASDTAVSTLEARGWSITSITKV